MQPKSGISWIRSTRAIRWATSSPGSNPSVRLKDGSKSSGKRILIDGQQRVTALMAALLGREVLTKDYETVAIHIAFHPVEERFEVSNPAIRKDSAWIS